MSYANLHTHSVFSDGVLSPRELLDHVIADRELTCFALTDHDSLSGIEPLFRALRDATPGHELTFIPGIELTTLDAEVGMVHVLGYFPGITAANLERELTRLDHVMGWYCKAACEDRTLRDFEGRIRHAYALNLDDMADLYDSPEAVMQRIQEKRQGRMKAIFDREGKAGDVIQYPIPLSYQDMIAEWTTILPQSSEEKARLYCLRSDPAKVKRMVEILLAEGLEDEEARALGSSLQGELMPAMASADVYLTPLEGMELLKEACAVTSIAHPGVSWPKYSVELFDERVTVPLTRAGLDGVEVYYPYHVAHRSYLTDHYAAFVREHELIATGGTDYHGDGRTALDTVKLDPALAAVLSEI